MRAWAVAVTAGSMAIAPMPPVAAQGAASSRTASDSALERALSRAQQLVADGKSADGRAVVDSLLAVSSPSSAGYATVLFTRGTLAGSAADAEGDYRRVAVEFPLSPRAPDALLRLAQLELARGDRAAALRHLDRVRTEYPGSAADAQGNFWMARTLFESNDVARGCAALARSRAATSSGDVEFRNQIDYEAQRCMGVDTVSRARESPSAGHAPGVPVGAVLPTGGSKRGRRGAAGGDPSAALRTPPAVAPAAAPAATPPAAGRFTVQLAAEKTKARAERLRRRVAAQGYDARVIGAPGQGALYRVRVGRYATYREAESVLSRLRRRGFPGFVADAEKR